MSLNLEFFYLVSCCAPPCSPNLITTGSKLSDASYSFVIRHGPQVKPARNNPDASAARHPHRLSFMVLKYG
ncbi:hypothetical protein BD289DRAFT_426609 [Coniella lustricola]|uniref:Uncharacterized protein n=1 Tax=Coniella lustricola TaxID=2025994 RepID=A0A2T3AG55_9PEZI|nr:hypothetical protein BD289DRAFT_426609 [Coniella lustricola]